MRKVTLFQTFKSSLQINHLQDMLRRIMTKLLPLAVVFLSTSASAQITSSQNLLPLRACAYAVSKTIEGDHIREGWASDDENSFYFLNCDDDYDQGQDHYAFTPSGVYYFFAKAHKDYKGGMEPTQFRLNLENKTYYFVSNCVGGMGDLFDESGKNLSSTEIEPERRSIDPSGKNPVINFYMKALTGKGDAKSALLALQLPPGRFEKAKSCMKKRISNLARSLTDVYQARSSRRQLDKATLDSYLSRLITALGTPECYADDEIGAQFESLLKRVQ